MFYTMFIVKFSFPISWNYMLHRFFDKSTIKVAWPSIILIWSCAGNSQELLSVGCVRSVMASVLSVIPMCAHVHLSVYVMSATMVHSKVGVSSVGVLAYLMPITARSAHSRRKIGMDARRSSTLGAPRLISSTSAKNMVSRKDDT